MNDPDLETRLQHARDLLRGYPEGTDAAAEAFLRNHDPRALEKLLEGVLTFHLPPKPNRPPTAELPGDSRLVEDLGFDSLAMVEMSFLVQDVTGVKLTDEELRGLRTLEELRALVRRRALAARG